ncbi:hypothetical protein, partial [Sphaerotilus sulfidivorans]
MTRKTKKTDKQRPGASSRKTPAAPHENVSRATPSGRNVKRSAPAGHGASDARSPAAVSESDARKGAQNAA